jgi:hypothetical protein
LLGEMSLAALPLLISRSSGWGQHKMLMKVVKES